METKKWYVGQKVWDKTVSDEAGKITRINHEEMDVEFESLKLAYSLNGVASRSITELPTLSTTPYEIKMEGFSQEVEEELPKNGQVVWVRDKDEQKWVIRHFIKKLHNKFVCSEDGNNYQATDWNQLTTKNPYEDSVVSEMENTDREPEIGDLVFAWSINNPSKVVCGKLTNIDEWHDLSYVIDSSNRFKYCSLKNPLIK